MAQVAAVGEATKQLADSGSGLSGVSEGFTELGSAAEEADQKVSLTRDSAGRLRNELGQFASDAEKAAAGLADAAHGVEDIGKSADKSTEKTSGFEAEFRRAMADAEKAGQDAARALQQSFSDVANASSTLRSAYDDTGKKIRDAGADAAGAGNGFNAGAAGIAAMVAGALALGPALAAIPAAGALIGGGLLTMGAAFTGVIKTIHDYATEQSNAASVGASSAATAFANGVAIRNAEQAIADAKRQAAISAQSSADAVAQADQRLTQAQEALTLAQRDGVNVLQDINLANESAANSVVDAQLAVQQAQENYDKVKNDSTISDLQKRQAQQSLIDAQFHLKDAQQKATEAQEAANDANAKGVQGSTAVVSAAQQVADAQHALARARQAQADQAVSSAEAVQKAEQQLADTRTQQALATQAASVANNKYAADLAKLTPAGQAFVATVIGMKGGLHQLAAEAQTATLPGFTQMLQDSAGMLPIAKQGIDALGGAASTTAGQFGQLMASPAFRGDLTSILSQAAGLAQQLGAGVVTMVGGISDAAAKAGPITKGLADGFQRLLGSGIPAFFTGLTSNATGAGGALSGFLGIVSNLLGPIGTLSGAVSAALGPALKVLADPQVAQALQQVATDVGQIFLALSPLVTLIAQGLVAALQFVLPLLNDMTGFIQDNQKWLVPLAGAIGAATLAWWGLNAAMAANPLVLVAGLLASLVAAVLYAWDHFDGFKNFIVGTWDTIKTTFATAIGWIEGKFSDLVDTITGLPGRLATAGKGMWAWFGAELKTVINDVIIGSMNWTIDRINGLTGGLSDLWSWAGVPRIGKIDDIPPLKALGGVARGLTGIHDQGIEMFNMPNGTVVMPHANTMSAMQSGAGAAGGPQIIQLEWVPGHAGDDFFEWLRGSIRARVGTSTNSVQVALGQTH